MPASPTTPQHPAPRDRSTSPTTSARDSTPGSTRGGWRPRSLRLMLWVGVALTLVSFAALILLLASYFLQLEAWPAFYWFGLFGLPAGFALMMAYVVVAAILRRRS